MKSLTFVSMCIMMLAFALVSCQKEPAAIGNTDCNTVTYSSIIAPLFTAQCNTSGCHHAGSEDGDLTTHAKVMKYVNNGKIEKEVLLRQTMPTSGPLSDVELA